MKGAIIHGILLVVMLVYGYRTWTRETSTGPDLGSVVLWDKSDPDLVSIELASETKIVKLERKTAGETFWWGSDTTITKTPKPVPPPPTDAGSGAGSGSAGSAAGSAAGSGSAGSGSAAGSGAGSGSAATPPPEMVETRKTRQFPLGDTGDKLVASFTAARAMRDLGKPTDEAKKDYKLTDAKTTLTITFKDGPQTFLVGGSVYGGADRYVLDQKSGKAYVMSKDLISGLEVGESSLHLTDPRGFDVTKIESVTIDAGGSMTAPAKTAVRVQAGAEGQQVKTWGDSATKKPNQTLANFIDNVNNLRPTEYAADLKFADLKPIVTITYKDARGAVLGTLALYKHTKAPTPPEGAEAPPANPMAVETEYFIVTPRTRVAAIVRKDTAERAEQDVPTVFSDKQVDSVDPKGNPFGKVPPGALDPHGGHGGAMPPGGPGSAAPAPTPAPPPPATGSAAPAVTAPATKPAAKPAAPAPKVETKPAPTEKAPAPVAPAPASPPAAAPTTTPMPAPAPTQ